jgi:hypothetical protein
MPRTATKKTAAAAAMSPKPMKEGVEQMTKGFEAAAAFGKGNVEAFVESSKIATEIARSLGAEIAEYSRRSFEVGMAAAQEMSNCKSLGALVEKQSEFGKVSMEGLVAETAKLNDMYSAAAKKMIAPLTARFNEAVQHAMHQRA